MAVRNRPNPNMARSSEKAREAAQSRYTPDARTRAAVRVLVARLRPLSEDEKAQLATLLKGGA